MANKKTSTARRYADIAFIVLIGLCVVLVVVYQAGAVADSLDDDATGTARPALVVTPRSTSPAAEPTRPAEEPTSPVEVPTNPPRTVRPSPTVNPDQDA